MTRRSSAVMGILAAALLASAPSLVQSVRADVLFADDFSRTTLNPTTDPARYATASMPLSGATGGASILGNALVLDSKFTGSTSKAGYFSVAKYLFPSGLGFRTDVLRWQVNLQASRVTSGVTTTLYAGGALLLASGVADYDNHGLGVFLEPTGVVLRQFTNGVKTGTNLASVTFAALGATATDWFSVDASYNCVTHDLTLAVRDDAAAPADPTTGTTGWLSAPMANAEQNANARYIGAYWQYGDGRSYTLAVDNLTVSSTAAVAPPTPEPTTLGLLAGGAAALLLRKRR